MMGVIGLLPAADVLGVSVVAAGKPFFGDVAFLPPVPTIKGHRNFIAFNFIQSISIASWLILLFNR